MPDLLIVNGEVIWDGNDIAIVEGDEAIKQQAYLRCVADVGESAFYPSYGSRIFMYRGKPYSRENRGYVEQTTRDALSEVEGIEEVLSAEFKSAAVSEREGMERTEFYIFAEYKTKSGEQGRGALKLPYGL